MDLFSDRGAEKVLKGLSRGENRGGDLEQQSDAKGGNRQTGRGPTPAVSERTA